MQFSSLAYYFTYSFSYRIIVIFTDAAQLVEVLSLKHQTVKSYFDFSVMKFGRIIQLPCGHRKASCRFQNPVKTKVFHFILQNRTVFGSLLI